MAKKFSSFSALWITKDQRGLTPLAYAFLVLLCIAFFTPGLGTLPPTDRDESSFAQATKQMIESGNYVDIRLQDKPRYKKPVGIYWLEALSVRLLNPTHLNEIWAYRIPSFLGATLAVLLTAALGTLLFGPAAGLLAAIMMAGCVILNVEARLAKTDATLLGSIMAMQYGLARAYFSRRSRERVHVTNVKAKFGTAFLFWTALGAGILIKGPIILLILASTLIWMRATEKNLKWLSVLKPIFGIPYVFLLVAPWFVAIMLESHGSFVAASAGHDLFAKLWQGQDRGIMPPGLHMLLLPIVFFPFALYTLLAIPDVWKNRHQPAVRFCLGWIIPAWAIFELSFTKLPHYTLPLYPAIAMLSAKALLDGYPALSEKGGRTVWAAILGLWLTIGTGFAFVFGFLPNLVDQTWSTLQIAAGLLLIVSQGAALFFLLQKKTESVLVLAAGSLCFMAVVFGSTLPSLQHFWISREATQLAEMNKPCDRSTLISASYGEPSLIFLAGTKTEIVPNGAEAAHALEKNPCQIGLIDEEQKTSFLEAFAASGVKPLATGSIEGFNSGHGRPIELTLYIMPPDISHP